MPRKVEVTVPPRSTKSLISDIEKLKEVISLRVYAGVSHKPKGDLIVIEITDKTLPRLIKLFAERDIGNTPDTSFSTSQPLSIISKSSNDLILTDTNESNWEEAEQTIAKESNPTINLLLLMFIAGAIAVYGIATNALHLVVGAMIIAPGFAPLLRISLGIAARSRDTWRRGLRSSAKTYAVLIFGAMTAYAFIRILNPEMAFGAQSTYLSSYELLNYWSSVTAVSVIVSGLAGIAGALLVATNRSVLTAGVMIALALVPSAALVGVGLASMNSDILWPSLLRFLIDVGLVIAAGLAVLKIKGKIIHKRALLPSDD